MSIENKIFCTAPFTTVRIESWSSDAETRTKDYGTVFKPGCVYHPHQPCNSLEEYLHGQDMEDHRHNLQFGTAPRPNCKECSVPESQGMTSIRKQLLNKPWAGNQKKIKLLDIFFGNTCNLGCVMCDPEWSSYISNERYKAGLIDQRISYKDNIDIALETMAKLPDLESVSFIGGEFFIVDSNIKILEKIKQRGLTATIITNATIINPSMLELLKNISSVELRISVDGVANGYEFIRYPASWKTLEHNIDLLKQQLPHADISLTTVLQMLSCQQIHELCEWANRRRLKINYQALSRPNSLRFSVLTPQEKDTLVQELEAKQNKKYLIARPQKEMIDELIRSIRLVEFSPEHRFQCVDFLSKLCAQRKITAEQIMQQFGVLGELAQEIIASCIESKRFAITKT